MNVTIKISDEICREVRTLLEALGSEELSGIDLEFARDRSAMRMRDLPETWP
jgi:hypothetical protein